MRNSLASLILGILSCIAIQTVALAQTPARPITEVYDITNSGTNAPWLTGSNVAAVADDGTDDTPAIQDAINYAQAISGGAVRGGIVFIPKGDYNIASPGLSITASGVTIMGEGPASILKVARNDSSEFSAISVTGTSTAPIDKIQIEKITIHKLNSGPTGFPTNPAAVGINLYWVFRSNFRDLQMAALGVGMKFEYSTNNHIENVKTEYCNYGLWIHGNNSSKPCNDWNCGNQFFAYWCNGLAEATTLPARGILIDGGAVGDLSFNDCWAVWVDVGVEIEASGSGYYNTGIQFTNLTTDWCTNFGLLARTTSWSSTSSQLTDVRLVGGYVGVQGHKFDSVRDVIISGASFNGPINPNNGSVAVRFENVTRGKVTGCTFKNMVNGVQIAPLSSNSTVHSKFCVVSSNSFSGLPVCSILLERAERCNVADNLLEGTIGGGSAGVGIFEYNSGSANNFITMNNTDNNFTYVDILHPGFYSLSSGYGTNGTIVIP